MRFKRIIFFNATLALLKVLTRVKAHLCACYAMRLLCACLLCYALACYAMRLLCACLLCYALACYAMRLLAMLCACYALAMLAIYSTKKAQ